MGLEFESPAGHQKSSHPFGWLLFCRWRFEKSSATVRWTVARCGLDRIDTIIFTEGENANESPAESRLRPHTERCGISYCRRRFEGSNATCRGHVAATSANTGGNHSSRPFPDAKANESPAGHFRFQFIAPFKTAQPGKNTTVIARSEATWQSPGRMPDAGKCLKYSTFCLILLF